MKKTFRPRHRLWGRVSLLALVVMTHRPQIAAACELTAGWHAATSPYVFEEQAGDVDGIDIRMLRLAAAEVGCAVTFVHRPWRRLMQELRQGTVAIGVDVDAASAMEAEAFPSDAYRDRRLRVWTRIQDFPSLRSLAIEEALNRNGVKIGLPLGFAARPLLRSKIDAAIGVGKAEAGGDAATVLQKMILGRVDLVFADEADAGHVLDTRNLRDAVRMLPLAVEPTGATYALSRRAVDPALRNRLNDAIGRVILDGLAVRPTSQQ